LRIAALIDTAEVSGPGRQLDALAVALRAHGVLLQVFLFDRPGRRPPYLAHLEALGVPFTQVLDRGRFDAAAASALAAALAAWQPDVVQTHSYKMTAFAALARTRGARWPWIAFYHGSTTEDLKVRLYHWLDRHLMSRADRIVVMSESQRASFGARRRREVQVLYNAVIPTMLDLPAVDLCTYRVPGVPLLGVVGRLSSEKGVDVFLEACADLVQSGVELTALLAGDGPERAALEAQAARLGLGERVHFLGVVQNVDTLYRQIDMLVLPSRSEGLPNVLLEALHRDVPVVSTNVGAVPEVIGDTPAAIVVPPGSAPALADAMRRGIASLGDVSAREARARVAARFSMEHHVAEHLRLYRSLASGHAGLDAPGLESSVDDSVMSASLSPSAR
jgi:glycosyltransferase involved in cell wall biosynthesis